MTRVAVVATAVVALAAACAPAPPQNVLELPLHPQAAHPDAGFVDGAPPDGGAGASCASGDGCDLRCDVLDADCPDGAVCNADGLCGSGCFAPDPDCSPLDDGLRCTFGEECRSGRCTFVDDQALCTRPCAGGRCAPGFACEAPADGSDALCLPSSCAAAGGAPGAGVCLAWWCRRRRRRSGKSRGFRREITMM